MSTKNKLQEYCQKHQLDLPEYRTRRISQLTDLPLFESILVFQNVTYQGQGLNKIAAEKDVADKVCQHLIDNEVNMPQFEVKYHSVRTLPIDKYQHIYLIDGDNCQVSNLNIFNQKSNFFIYFIAKNNTKVVPFIHQKDYINCCVMISESIGRDAVDHLLTFYLGQLTLLWADRDYYVVTRDHFGECLTKIAPNCQLVCSL